MSNSVSCDTKYRGICKTNNRWVSHICVGERVFYLGLFATEVLAARAWDAAVYWLRERLDSKAHDYNFPDETESMPPLISARLAEIMTELRLVIPEGAPRETPFVDIFTEVMNDWFEQNKTATEWEGTATELHQLFKYTLSGISVRRLGILVRKLQGIRYRRSNGQALIVIDRAAVTGSSQPEPKRLNRKSLKPVIAALNRFMSNQTSENFLKARVAFGTWSEETAKTLSAPADVRGLGLVPISDVIAIVT